jgi:hypothetical protein
MGSSSDIPLVRSASPHAHVCVSISVGMAGTTATIRPLFPRLGPTWAQSGHGMSVSNTAQPAWHRETRLCAAQSVVGRGRQRRPRQLAGRQSLCLSFHFPFCHHHQLHITTIIVNRQHPSTSAVCILSVHTQRASPQAQALQIIAYSSPRKAPRSGTCLLGRTNHVTLNLTL